MKSLSHNNIAYNRWRWAMSLAIALCLILSVGGGAIAQQTPPLSDPSQQDPDYDNRKRQQIVPPITDNPEASRPKAAPAARPACFEPFSSTGADGWTSLPRNDDGFIGPIPLGFDFSLFGATYNSVYINNNGNVTFNSGVSQYSPDGFPIGIPMVAAFWADVDTRNTDSGLVWYKVFPDRLVVTWDRVGYFSSKVDKLNTFQLVIRANTAPGFVGDDVTFAYDDMQWTTGDASAGVQGFGGSPATVGANRGNNLDFIQTGRFNLNSNQPPNVPTTGSAGGIDWLDGQCLGYQVRSGSGNLPPTVAGLPAGNSITLTQGESRTLSLQFAGPETTQNVQVTTNLNGLCSATTVITNNNAPNPTAIFSVTGGTCNTGTNIVSFTATDNGSPVLSQIFTVTIVVNAPVSSTTTLPPIAPVVGSQIATAGGSATLAIPSFTAVNAGQSLTYSAAGLPPGCVFNAVTRVISGTPTVAGLYSITITATTLPFGSVPGGVSTNLIFSTEIVLPPAFIGLPTNNSVTLVQGELRLITLQCAGASASLSCTAGVNLNGLCNATATIGNNNTPTPTISLSILGAACNTGTAVLSFSVAYVGMPSSVQSFTVAVTVITCQLADTRLSVRSGRWHDASTWSCGQVPTNGDRVRIQAAHTVTIGASQTANCRTLQFDNPQARLLYEANARLVMGGTGVPRNGLIAYYPFNGNAKASVGGNDGNVVGATLTTDRYGNANRAYAFNGTNNYIDMPTSGTLLVNDQITLSAWVNIDPTNGHNSIFQKGESGINWDYGLMTDGSRVCYRSYWGDWTTADMPNTNFDKWIFVAVILDENGANRPQFFVNSTKYTGALVQTQGYRGESDWIRQSNQTIRVGLGHPSWNEFFKGSIDEIRIYNRALTDAEILQLYQAEKP